MMAAVLDGSSTLERLGVEAPGRVELPTNGLGNRCSIHLSYGANVGNSLILLSLLQNGLYVFFQNRLNCARSVPELLESLHFLCRVPKILLVNDSVTVKGGAGLV